MEHQEGPSVAAALEHRVRGGASAAEIANVVADAWLEVEASLNPIIGPKGVAALYKRSLLLTARSHPWLDEPSERPQEGAHLAALTLVLAHQESKAAAAGGGELLQTFYGLVSSLIGASLTHRLLRFMWQKFR